MNILFLTPSNSKKNLGGVERHVRLLTEELTRRGNEVKELALDGVYKGPAFEYKGRAFTYKFLAWKWLWERREMFRWADIVHVHDVFWWVLPFLLMTKTKVFVTFHGWEGKCPPTKSAVWQKKLAAWLSRGTIGVGNFYEKWYGVKVDGVIWGVLDSRIARIAKISEKRERGLYKGPTLPRQGRTLRRIIFLGRLEEVNGIKVVIKAITPRLGLSIVFVGDGNWRKQAERVGKVTGMVAEPWKYLADADVVIASSYLAILEATALGKRIIAIANNPLKRDYLESHPLGRYFKICGSADELAREIIKSIEETPRLGGESPLRARLWARRQTPVELADVYEELWKSKSA